jgi:hypothetical protein
MSRLLLVEGDLDGNGTAGFQIELVMPAGLFAKTADSVLLCGASGADPPTVRD